MDTTEEEVAALRQAATSSFVPVPTAEMPSPFTIEDNAAYSRYLAAIDPGRGTWWSMIQPGARGFGLFVSFHNPYICCNGLDGRMAEDDDEGIPLLFPGLVEWVSVIDPVNGKMQLEASRDYEYDLDFPPVGIVGSWFVDDGEIMPMTNMLHSEDMQWGEMWNYLGVGEEVLMGLAAPWQILPITEEAYRLLKDWLPAASERTDSGVLQFTNCALLEMESDSDADEDGYDPYSYRDPRMKADHGTPECEYLLENERCACGEEPTIFQSYIALLRPLVQRTYTVEELFLPPELSEAWRLAQLYYTRAWIAVHARADQGDAWSTYCWRRLSPFSGSRSLEALLRRLSTPSTSSPTPRASSPASSQLSMQYG